MTASIEVDLSDVTKRFDRAARGIDNSLVLAAVGKRLLRWVDDNFRQSGIERRWAPLKPSTIAGRRKGSSKPLLDTGQMRRTFVMRVVGNAVLVGSQSEIASYHHHGTKPYVIRPKRGQFLKFKGAGGQNVFVREVHHPGLPARPLLPTKSLATSLAVEAADRFVSAKIEKELGRGAR